MTTNLRIARKLGPKTELTLDVFNLFDRKVNEIEYYYESQLPGEAAPVADKHVHPAEQNHSPYASSGLLSTRSSEESAPFALQAWPVQWLFCVVGSDCLGSGAPGDAPHL